MLPLTKCASNLQLDNSKFLLPISYFLVTVSQLGGGNPVKYLARAHCTVCGSACLGLFCHCAIILYYIIILCYYIIRHISYIVLLYHIVCPTLCLKSQRQKPTYITTRNFKHYRPYQILADALQVPWSMLDVFDDPEDE